jgi:ABC-2 type transport system ATP-binding protein
VTSSTPDALWSSRSVRALHPAAVEVRGLRSRQPRFGRLGRPAEASELRGVDLSVPVGARLLVVSRPEGAATLLLRILAGAARPASGTISIAGTTRGDESADGWARRIGYVSGEPAIYDWLSPVEALSLAARLAGLTAERGQGRVDQLVERFRLGPDASRPIARGGPVAAQKVSLAAALLTEPEVLLLDEPLRSLDPLERRRLLKVSGQRTTLLLASRYPASEEGLVNQVALIRDGRLALHAAVEDLVAAALPLSARGVEALADQRAAGGSATPAAQPAPARAEAASR